MFIGKKAPAALRKQLWPVFPTYNILGSRNIYVMSHERRKKAAKRKSDKLQQWAEQEEMRLAREKNQQYAKKLKELKQLTRSVASYVRTREARELEAQKIQELALPSELGKGSEPAGLAAPGSTKVAPFDASAASLSTSAVPLPQSIQDRLGLAVKYLVSKDHQNWSIVLQQLEAAGGFDGLPQKDIRKMVYAIPKDQLRHVFPQIESLLGQAGLAVSPKLLNTYIKSLMLGRTLNDAQIAHIEGIVAKLRQEPGKEGKLGKLSRATYELLIEAYGKNTNVAKMNEVIQEMKELGLQLSPVVYTNVLSTCVYKTRDHQQAVKLFDLMKFLAGSMAPQTREYQDIIVSYVNNDDIEKALDLYQEMLDQKLDFNQNIMVALARGCMSREQLRFKAWDFIFEIYRCGWEPTANTLEYMLYLASKDGDLALARALYQQLNISNALSPRAFSFLFLAYARSNVGKLIEEFQPFAITVHEEGRNFRRNILEKVDLTPSTENPKQAVPYLPKISLSTPQEVLAESSAVMAHALMVNREFVNVESVTTFLNVAARMGSLDDFIDRYEEFTFLDKTGVTETKTVIEPEILESTCVLLAPKEPSPTKSPILAQVTESQKSAFKMPRNTITYLIALKAAAKHKNYIFAQKVWTERGTYRKSAAFRNLPKSEKEKLDFSFASGMVNCLTDMKLLDDALAILVSTEYQFKWTWKELLHLYAAAAEAGYDKVTKTIRGVVKRAQINFEGKIRRKDYKKYVMERGY